MGLYDFFYSGENAQYIAGMTHANLPNSIVLERDWYEFKAYPPLPAKQKWSNDRIIAGGGWGMRLLRSNRQPKPPIEPPEQNNDKGDYRVDTDVITSFWIHTDGRVTPDNPTKDNLSYCPLVCLITNVSLGILVIRIWCLSGLMVRMILASLLDTDEISPPVSMPEIKMVNVSVETFTLSGFSKSVLYEYEAMIL